MVTTCSPRPMRAVQRARLCAITCTASQAPLAAKRQRCELGVPRASWRIPVWAGSRNDSCAPRGAEESEVLFTLIAERYERRSLGITSNLVFSEWERIFANPMATAAAIDRVMHHPSSWSLTSPATALMPLSNGAQTEEVNRQKMLDAGHRRP